MLIIRKSSISGNMNTMDIPISEDHLRLWQSGQMIQDVMPNITADQREFILSGITPEEWDEAFKDFDTEPILGYESTKQDPHEDIPF
jgi:hypothetical protein